MNTQPPPRLSPSSQAAPARLAWKIFSVGLIATLVAGFFGRSPAEFGVEGTFGFNAWFGFLSCAGIVFGSRLLGWFLKRPARYYEEDPGDPPDNRG